MGTLTLLFGVAAFLSFGALTATDGDPVAWIAALVTTGLFILCGLAWLS